MTGDAPRETHLARWRIVEVPCGLGLQRRMFGRKRGGGWRISSPIVEESSAWVCTQSGSLYYKDGAEMIFEEPDLHALAYFLENEGVDRRSTLCILALALADNPHTPGQEGS
jgi:hypothetical protein